MKIESGSLSGFTDWKVNEVLVGLKGQAQLDKNRDLVMILCGQKTRHGWSAKFMSEMKFLSYQRKHPIPETSINTINHSFPAPPVEKLEEFFQSLKGFPLQQYKQISSFIAIAQQHNYLLIFVGIICFLIRINLQANLCCPLLLEHQFSSKNYGKFRWKYIFPGYMVNDKFIGKIYKSQLKNKKSLQFYQIVSDFKYYRTGFATYIQITNKVIYFYFLLPFFSLLEKYALAFFWGVISWCLNHFSFSVPTVIQNIWNSKPIVNTSFLFAVIVVAVINYIPVNFVSTNTTKYDNELFNFCIKKMNNSTLNTTNTPFKKT